MANSKFVALDALVALICSSVETIKEEWQKDEITEPNLDSISPHPADSGAAQGITLKKALQVLEGACAQLVVTTATPAHVLVNVRLLIFVRLSEDYEG